MYSKLKAYSKRKNLLYQVLRALIEMGFIVFLFYSNLLMGEYDRSGNGRKHDLFWSLHDILTLNNFEIAVAAAIVGYLVFEFLRRKL